MVGGKAAASGLPGVGERAQKCQKCQSAKDSLEEDGVGQAEANGEYNTRDV